jgi:uncharacterized damage-inducible protein DinB
MTSVSLWFERKFDFSFPAELYPNICVRLRGTPARLDEMLIGQPHEKLTQKSDNSWSAQEQAGHLLDLEPLWLARVEDYVAGRAELTAADLTNRKTREAGHNNRPLDEILRGFRNARSRLVNQLGQMDPTLSSRTLLHPRMKTPMRLVDHLYFVAEHDDHHLARIWELVGTRPVDH